MEALCGSLDLEEMDAEQREELEAMLYAQVHHSASGDVAEMEVMALENGSQPLVSSGMCEMRQTKTLGAMEAVDSVHGNRGADVSENATKKLETSHNGVKMNEQKSTEQSSEMKTGSGVSRSVRDPNLGLQPSGSNTSSALFGESGATTSKPAPSVTSVRQSGCSIEPTPGLRSEPAQPPRLQPAGLTVGSRTDEPETKTAALAAASRRRRRPPSSATITIGSSESEASSDDQQVIDAARSACSGRGALSREMRRPDQARPAASHAGRSACSSPEVLELTPAGSPTSSSDSDTSSTASAAATVRPEATASATAAACVPAARSGAATAQKSAGARRACSLGAARPGGRPRTSSDFSSSESDVEPAELSCDIQVNVLGPSNSSAARQQRRDGAEEGAAGTETCEGQASLPGPSYRRVQQQLQLEPTPLLHSLGRAAACHKWSRSQLRAYSTPRQYGLDNVDTFLDRLPDGGWEIPTSFQAGAFASKQARARYYSTLQRGKCRRCDGEGHVQSNCPLPPVCHLCGGAGHASALRCASMFCYLCGAEDHLEPRCPRHVRPVFCALCKAKGHTSDMCSDRWRRYHTTTAAAVPPVAPPQSLDLKKRSRQRCWQCGGNGHPGHQCRGDRYTGLASISQQLISYTAAVCASSSVSGLVATPAQMDAVFSSKTRQSIEKDSGAALSYEELGHGSWLINISGALEAAQRAHCLVVQVMNGGDVGARPRPQSAPSSPLRVLEEDRPGGSAPSSPIPAEEESVKAMRKRQKKERRRDIRRKRKLKALEEVAGGGAVQGRGGPITSAADESAGDDASSEVMVVEEMAVPSSSSGPKPKKARRQRVELVTVVSDGEEGGRDSDCDEPQVVETGPESGLDQMLATARLWKLNLLEGDSSCPTHEQAARSSAHRQLKRTRKEILDKLKSAPGASKRQAAAGEAGSSSSSDSVVVVTSSDAELVDPATAPRTSKNKRCTTGSKRQGKDSGAVVSVVGANDSETGATGAADETAQLPSKKQRKAEKAARLAASSESQQPSTLQTGTTAAQAGKSKKRKRGSPPRVRCYMTSKLEKLVAAEGTDSPAVRKLKRLLKRQQKKAVKAQEVSGSRRKTLNGSDGCA